MTNESLHYKTEILNRDKFTTLMFIKTLTIIIITKCNFKFLTIFRHFYFYFGDPYFLNFILRQNIIFIFETSLHEIH